MEKFIRKGFENATIFMGPEVEQTPAFSKKTLFVVGLHRLETIEKLAIQRRINHIFLGANRSFDSVAMVNGRYMVGDTLASDWEKLLHVLLDKGYMVSLDYPAHKHVDVLKILGPSIWQCRNFIPILSVAIPNVNTSNVNLTIKIDDISFGETNPGVWCINHNQVTDSNRFTAWNEYNDDMILQFQDDVTIATEVVSNVEVKNDSSIGIDPIPTTALKPDAEETDKALPITHPKSADAVAEIYAAGTTTDPLKKETIKKPIKKVKV